MRRRALRTTIVLVLTVATAATLTGPAHAAERLVDPPLPECSIVVAPDERGKVTVTPVVENLTTGRDNGGLIAFEQPDDTWSVPALGIDAYVVEPGPYDNWLPVTDGRWISSSRYRHSTGAADPLPAEPGDVLGPLPVVNPRRLPARLTYRATFTVPTRTLHSRLNLAFAVDNTVEFRLNGVPIGGYGAHDGAAFTAAHPLLYSGPLFRDGLNTLDATVTDFGVATGLYVSGQYEGCRVSATASTS